jgi:hypothetical protein
MRENGATFLDKTKIKIKGVFDVAFFKDYGQPANRLK